MPVLWGNIISYALFMYTLKHDMCKRSLSILVMICFGCAWRILPCMMLSVCNELFDFYCILDEKLLNIILKVWLDFLILSYWKLNKNPVSINWLAVRPIYCTTYKTCFVFIRTIRRFQLSNHLKRRANYIPKFEHSNVCPYTCFISYAQYSFHVCSCTKKVCTSDIFYHRSKNILSQDICFIVLSDLFKTAVPWFCFFRLK